MELIKWDEINQSIATEQDLLVLSEMQNHLEAMRLYNKQIEGSIETQNKIAKYKIEVESKIGTLYDGIKANNGKRSDLVTLGVTRLNITNKQELTNEINRSRVTLHRWKQEAEINNNIKQEYYNECEQNKTEITSSGLLKFNKSFENKNRVNEAIKQADNYKQNSAIKILEGDLFDRINDVPDNSIDLLITDPPYLVMNDYEWDKQSIEFLDKWIKIIIPKLKREYIGFIFCDARMVFEFEKVLNKYFKIKNRLIWVRKNMSMGRVVKDRFISSYEVCFYFGNKELNYPDEWGAERFDTMEYATPQSNFKEGKFHPTQKPLELFRKLIKLGSDKSSVVLDCFAGSGTTGIICKELDRNCVLVEQDKEYVKIIKGRLSELF